MADDKGQWQESAGGAQLAPVPDTHKVETQVGPTDRSSPVEASYAMSLADGSYKWYRDHAIRSRAAYKISETALLIVSAAVPVSAVVVPNDATVPAILGGVVVVLAGLRSVFHWQDNYLRFS